jgi:hypothetical protein
MAPRSQPRRYGAPLWLEALNHYAICAAILSAQANEERREMAVIGTALARPVLLGLGVSEPVHG